MSWTDDEFEEIRALGAARWPQKPYAGSVETWGTLRGWLAAYPFEQARAALLYIADQGEGFPSIKRMVDVAKTLPAPR